VREEKNKIIEELGAQPSDELFMAVHGFFIYTALDSPLTSIQPGSTVRLSHETAATLFLDNKIIPESIPESAEYVSLTSFNFENGGKIFWVEKFDKVKLNKEEAIVLMRDRKVRPLSDAVYTPWENNWRLK
jgi:hypothetical protein